MRVLAVTNLYPRTPSESVGVFVKEQLDSLSAAGVEVDVLHVDRTRRGEARIAASAFGFASAWVRRNPTCSMSCTAA